MGWDAPTPPGPAALRAYVTWICPRKAGVDRVRAATDVRTESGALASADTLEVANLTPLMERTRGRPDVAVGLIDGPVFVDHPDLAEARIENLPGPIEGACVPATGAACMHGTFVAGVLVGARGKSAPAICSECTLVVRAIFSEQATAVGGFPAATSDELAAALVDTVNAGAWVINLSASVARGSAAGARLIAQALDYAASRGVIIVAAAGNQGNVGGSAIVSHRWVIPVVACDLEGRPLRDSDLGHSIGRRGLSAPGADITSLSEAGGTRTLSGTSAAAAFVTGAVALIWSEDPRTPAANLRFALTQAYSPRRALVPPLLDAWSASNFLAAGRRRHSGRRQVSEREA